MSINLEEMTLPELKDLRVRLNKALVAVEDRERKAALAAVDEVVRQHGFHSYADLLVSSKKPGRSTASASITPKYRNPLDESQTWSGRGRHPQWVTQALAEGRSLGEMQIEPAVQDASEQPVSKRRRSLPDEQTEAPRSDAA